MQSLPKPRINLWLASYIDQHHGKQTRYEIDKYLIEAGYNPAEIEYAWQIRGQNNYGLSKPKFKWKFGKLKDAGLGPVMLLGAVLLILFSFVFIPGEASMSLFGKLHGMGAVLVTLLPPIGSVAGAIIGYVWPFSDNKRYALMGIGALLFTLVATLIIGRPPGTGEGEEIIYLPVLFVMMYFPAGAMLLVFLLFEASGLLIKVEE